MGTHIDREILCRSTEEHKRLQEWLTARGVAFSLPASRVARFRLPKNHKMPPDLRVIVSANAAPLLKEFRQNNPA